MSKNKIDQAFQIEKLKMEANQIEARRTLDALARMTFESQTSEELTFNVDLNEDGLYLRRYPYTICAEINENAVAVRLRKEDSSNYENAMLGGLAAMMKPGVDLDNAANQLGILMARVIENRIF